MTQQQILNQVLISGYGIYKATQECKDKVTGMVKGFFVKFSGQTGDFQLYVSSEKFAGLNIDKLVVGEFYKYTGSSRWSSYSDENSTYVNSRLGGHNIHTIEAVKVEVKVSA